MSKKAVSLNNLTIHFHFCSRWSRIHLYAISSFSRGINSSLICTSMMQEQEVLVVGTKVKAYVKSKGCMTSGDVLDALNMKVHRLLDEATERTKSNKRSTLRAADL